MKLSDCVGNTPLIPIRFGGYTVWGKCEFMNPGGSVKDRMATYIINNAEQNGLIKKGDTLIEATSGNTGIAFAMLSELEGYFNCNQFHNKLNIEVHYKTTGPEIWKEFQRNHKYNDCGWMQAFVAGTGTGGTIMGAGKYLSEQCPGMETIAVEPEESAVMSGGKPGLHGIQGIGDGSKFLVDLKKISKVKTVKTECAKAVAKYLAQRYGLFVGISAGANVFAAFQYLHDNNKKTAITILCDRGERYLSCL